MRSKAPQRIVLEFHERTSERQRRELGAFVRFCVHRMERELGELRWLVRFTPTREGFTCVVTVAIENLLVEARGKGFDGVSAAWDALSNLDQGLRESRTDSESDHLAAVANS